MFKDALTNCQYPLSQELCTSTPWRLEASRVGRRLHLFESLGSEEIPTVSRIHRCHVTGNAVAYVRTLRCAATETLPVSVFGSESVRWVKKRQRSKGAEKTAVLAITHVPHAKRFPHGMLSFFTTQPSLVTERQFWLLCDNW